MKKISLIFMSLFVLGITLNSFAQNKSGKMKNQQNRLYNINTVETVTGEVVSLDEQTGKRGFNGIHVTLKTDDGNLSVHLGPEWFIDKQTVKIAKGDQIEVTGSKITYNEKPALIAKLVKRGSETLTLRDDKGYPVWKGQGMKNKS